MNNKKNKIWFIVLVSIFGVLWLTSLTFLGISALSETTTNNIESWYAEKFTEKTLNLLNVSVWLTIISTTGLVITLLFKELKKKYLVR